jgi:hypothetical protein
MLEASYTKSSPSAGVTSSSIRRDREHDETDCRLTSGGDGGGLNAMICAVALRAASAYGWDAALLQTARGLGIRPGDD